MSTAVSSHDLMHISLISPSSEAVPPLCTHSNHHNTPGNVPTALFAANHKNPSMLRYA